MAPTPRSRPARRIPPVRKSTSAPPNETRVEIVQAARRILATVGYARFTMRAVAHEAGLAVGNLVYHYPSKRRLIHALIDSLMEYYQNKSTGYLRKSGRGPRDGLAGLIRYYMKDSVASETSRLFRELWTMALHDDEIASAMDRFYREAHETAVKLVQLSHPGLDGRRAHDIVQLMGTVSEGANVIFATAQASSASRKRVARLAGELLTRAARNFGRAHS